MPSPKFPFDASKNEVHTLIPSRGIYFLIDARIRED